MNRNKANSTPTTNRGFSLLEMAAALSLSMGVAGASLAIITQHTYFMRQINAFSFIREEAPQINRILTSLLSSASDYAIYDEKSGAFSNGTVSNSGTALLLFYRSPSGIPDRTAIIFETTGDSKSLNLYNYRNGWSSEPGWTITSIADDVLFADHSGMLTIELSGQRGEEITYMGGTR